MFSRRPDWKRKSGAKRLKITFEGASVNALEGDSVAAAILSTEPGYTRQTPVSGSQRAPYCMMGVCFECLMEIDGIPNRQACMVQVRNGMDVRRQKQPSHPKTDRESGRDED